MAFTKLAARLNRAPQDVEDQISNISNGRSPSLPGFPFQDLKKVGQAFVSKRKNLAPVDLEQQLLALIRSHYRIEVALAAFTPCLNTEPVRLILKEQSWKWSQGETTLNTLKEVIAVINHWRPDLASNTELFYTKALMSLQTKLASAQTDERPMILAIFNTTTQFPDNVIVSEAVRNITEYHFSLLARQLDDCKRDMDWNTAFKLVYWLPGLRTSIERHSSAGYVSFREIVDEVFPDCTAWASWQPNEERIVRLKSWKPENRQYFRDFMALDGPCFLNPVVASQKEFLLELVTEEGMLYLGSLVVSLSSINRTHVDSILNILIESVYRSAQSAGQQYINTIELVRQTACSRLLKESVIKAVGECVLRPTKPEIISAAMLVLFSSTPSGDMPLDALLTLANIMNNPDYRDLTSATGEIVRSGLSEYLAEKQELVRIPTNPPSNWKDSDISNLERLQKFGEKLRATKIGESNATVRQWPRNDDFARWTKILRVLQGNSNNPEALMLIQKYLRHRFIQTEPLDAYERQSAELFIENWASGSTRQDLLIIITEQTYSSPNRSVSRFQYLKSYALLEEELVTRLVGLYAENCSGNFMGLCLVLQSLAKHGGDIISQWQFVPLWHIEIRQANDILEWAIDSLPLPEYLEFLSNIGIVFASLMSGKARNQDNLLFNSYVADWATKLISYRLVIDELEKLPGLGHALRVIVRGSEDDDHRSLLEEILRILSATVTGPKQTVMLELLKFLDSDVRNTNLILAALNSTLFVTANGLWLLEFIISSYHILSVQVVETMIIYILQDETLDSSDYDAIDIVAGLIALETDRQSVAGWAAPDNKGAFAADAFLKEEMQYLVSEAMRLESLRKSLNKQDRDATLALIADLDIEDHTGLRELVESVPVDLVNSVELVSEDVFELQIPIDSIKPLTRKAIGAAEATSFVVRFSGSPAELPLRFCIHFNTDIKPLKVKFHTQTTVHKDTHLQLACYNRMTPLVYHLSQRLAKFLQQAKGLFSIKTTYDFLIEEINSLGTSCTICGKLHDDVQNTNGPSSSKSPVYQGARRILTTCGSVSCVYGMSMFPCDVRLASLFEDPHVLDMLLQGISAAIHGGFYSSLPPPPENIDEQKIKNMLNSLPSMANLCLSSELGKRLATTDTANSFAAGTTLDILTWVATNYDGFITRATDSLMLPSWPASHQFLLADSNPRREKGFAAQVSKMASGETTQIMFHGTTMSRLPMILAEGLKVLSGSTLQLHGSSFGKGIYLSPEPSTAWLYSAALSETQSWRNSQYKKDGYGVLLGCELAGKWSPVSSNKNIYVVSDSSCVAVRFVILLPKKKRVPVSQHVIPAMTSIFANLRSGAI